MHVTSMLTRVTKSLKVLPRLIDASTRVGLVRVTKKWFMAVGFGFGLGYNPKQE